MTEEYFWAALEYRLCRELAGMSKTQLRGLWCDGIYPTQYLLDDPAPRILGRAWICASRQEQWNFTLFLPHTCESPAAVNWVALLPPENVTRWLALDAPGKRLQIEPAAAVPDLD